MGAVLGTGGPASASIGPGDRGPAVQAMEERLSALGFDPGPVDGGYDWDTRFAVWAFQKSVGLKPSTTVGETTSRKLSTAKPGRTRLRNGIEIDLRNGLLRVVRHHRPVLISHISGGAPGMPTPTGRFRVYRRLKGWRHAPLGDMYKPLYFHRGHSIHGSVLVPKWHASHGCVRVPMHVADRFQGLIRHGDRVVVRP